MAHCVSLSSYACAAWCCRSSTGLGDEFVLKFGKNDPEIYDWHHCIPTTMTTTTTSPQPRTVTVALSDLENGSVSLDTLEEAFGADSLGIIIVQGLPERYAARKRPICDGTELFYRCEIKPRTRAGRCTDSQRATRRGLVLLGHECCMLLELQEERKGTGRR